MSLKEYMENQLNLNGLIDDFDRHTKGIIKAMRTVTGKSVMVKDLPKWMRLIPYFVASGNAETGQLWISSEGVDFYVDESRGKGSSSRFNPKIAMHIGDAKLRHSIEKQYSKDPFYLEKLVLETDDETKEAGICLYSGNTRFRGGYKGGIDVNKVGITLNVDDEVLFEGFLRKNRISFDNDRYEVTQNRYSFGITPKFDITKGTFTQTVNEMINIADHVLEILERKYHKTCYHLKRPSGQR